jgi:hypothetical protein
MIQLTRPDGSRVFIRPDAVVAVEPPRLGADQKARATILLSTGVERDVAQPPEGVLAELRKEGVNV